jgi:hypothetical protein
MLDDWCDQDEQRDKKKRFWKLTEKTGGREKIH